MTKSLLMEKEKAFSMPSLSDKYRNLVKIPKVEPISSPVNNRPETKLVRKNNRESHATVTCRKLSGYRAEVLPRRLFKAIQLFDLLTEKIQEKTSASNHPENVQIPETLRIELSTLQREPTPRVADYKPSASDIANGITQALSQVLNELQRSYSSSNTKSLESNLGDSRFSVLEQRLKSATKQESLEIIQQLANEGYQAAPTLRRLIESEDDPDIYKEAANVLMLILQ